MRVGLRVTPPAFAAKALERGMTRPQTFEQLRRLAAGLSPDDTSVRRLLERITAEDEPERLRALLVELGAKSLLDGDAGVGARR